MRLDFRRRIATATAASRAKPSPHPSGIPTPTNAVPQREGERPPPPSGDGRVVPLKLPPTESIIAVVVAELLPLERTKPIQTFCPIEMAADPTSVQVVPSGETSPVRVLPILASLTQVGAVAADPAVVKTLPPVVTRLRNVVPLPAARAEQAKVEVASSVSRIMTPAMAPEAVPRPATRAVISPSPDNDR